MGADGSRTRRRPLETIVITTSPCWLVHGLASILVRPMSGRDFERRLSISSTLDRQLVARIDGLHPPQFVDAGRAETGGRLGVLPGIHHHAHHHRAGMPARRRKTAEERVLRGLVIQMERLGIIFRGELDHLFARHLVGPRGRACACRSPCLRNIACRPAPCLSDNTGSCRNNRSLASVTQREGMRLPSSIARTSFGNATGV